MRVLIVSTHRADKAHYAPLGRVLNGDSRFVVMPPPPKGEYPFGSPYSVPDIALVLGDRKEMLEQAILCVEERIPLLHIHGGEHTYGSLDERWRWAISELADIHCVAHVDAELALRRYDPRHYTGSPGHDLARRVVVTGAPGLDDILPRSPVAFPHEAIIHYNPVIDPAQSKLEFQAIVEGLGIHTPRRLFSLEQTLWIKMNGDRGSFGVGDELEPNAYRDAVAAAKVIIGNTSAGIIEAPSLGTWFVNVGDRQKGRVRAGNVIDVLADPEGIREAVLDALSRPRYSGPNPYYIDGHASERIRDVLLTMA